MPFSLSENSKTSLYYKIVSCCAIKLVNELCFPWCKERSSCATILQYSSDHFRVASCVLQKRIIVVLFVLGVLDILCLGALRFLQDQRVPDRCWISAV